MTKSSYRKEYYEKNKDRIAVHQQKYHLKHREHVLMRRKAYKARNKDTIAAQHKEYQQRNRDRINAYQRERRRRMRLAREGNNAAPSSDDGNMSSRDVSEDMDVDANPQHLDKMSLAFLLQPSD